MEATLSVMAWVCGPIHVVRLQDAGTQGRTEPSHLGQKDAVVMQDGVGALPQARLCPEVCYDAHLHWERVLSGPWMPEGSVVRTRNMLMRHNKQLYAGTPSPGLGVLVKS